MTELVHLDVAAGVATITLDSPANRNALSAQLRRELLAHLDAALADDAARVLVLAHTGRVFCAGMDLKEGRGGGAGDQGVNEFPTILARVWDSPKPVVAKVAGPARAGGVGLVAACDVAVAAQEATFAFSEVRIGVVPAVISVTVLPRLLPRAAHELFLTGETFGAARAVASGWSTPASPPTGWTRRCSATPGCCGSVRPAPSRRRRGCCGGTASGTGSPRCRSCRPGSSRARRGRRGMAAFAEKRPPSWAVS
jgi:methylglutaconyl-CoA hydratase